MWTSILLIFIIGEGYAVFHQLRFCILGLCYFKGKKVIFIVPGYLLTLTGHFSTEVTLYEMGSDYGNSKLMSQKT